MLGPRDLAPGNRQRARAFGATAKDHRRARGRSQPFATGHPGSGDRRPLGRRRSM